MNNQAINGNNPTMNIWDNPANYKKCVKKQYEIWVCQPPQGTVVINKLEQADSVSACRGRTVFAPFEIERNPQIKALCEQLVTSGKAYIVNNPQTFVLSGTRGELWCIKGDKLAKKYVWASDNAPINAQTLKSRLGDAKYLGWQKVRTIPDNSAAYACFVPAKIQGQIQTSWAILNINGRGVPHGKGDFVISQPGADGKPSADRYVVNGAVFADTYDNRGWVDCLAPQSGTVAEKPKELYSIDTMNRKSLSEFRHEFLQKIGTSLWQGMSFPGGWTGICKDYQDSFAIRFVNSSQLKIVFNYMITGKEGTNTANGFTIRLRFTDNKTLNVSGREGGLDFNASYFYDLDDTRMTEGAESEQLRSKLSMAILFDLLKTLRVSPYAWLLSRTCYNFAHKEMYEHPEHYAASTASFEAKWNNSDCISAEHLNYVCTIKKDSFKSGVSKTNKGVQRAHFMLRLLSRRDKSELAEFPVDVTLDSTLWDEVNRTDASVKSTSLRGKGWITADYTKMFPTLRLVIAGNVVYDSVESCKKYGLDCIGGNKFGYTFSLVSYSDAICNTYIRLLRSGKCGAYNTLSQLDAAVVDHSKHSVEEFLRGYPAIMRSFVPLALKGFKKTMGTAVDTTCAMIIPFVSSKIEIDGNVVNETLNSRFDFISLSNGTAYLRDVSTNNVVDLNASGVNKHNILMQVCEDFKRYVSTVDVARDTQLVSANIDKKGSVRRIA